MYHLGYSHAKGEGAAMDAKKAVEWYGKALEKGSRSLMRCHDVYEPATSKALGCGQELKNNATG